MRSLSPPVSSFFVTFCKTKLKICNLIFSIQKQIKVNFKLAKSYLSLHKYRMDSEFKNMPNVRVTAGPPGVRFGSSLDSIHGGNKYKNN
jgi:hypothetical protein